MRDIYDVATIIQTLHEDGTVTLCPDMSGTSKDSGMRTLRFRMVNSSTADSQTVTLSPLDPVAGLPGGLQGETSLVDYVTVPKEALDDCYSGKNTAAATSGIMMRWATTRDIFNVAIDTAVFVSKDGQYSISAFVKDPKAQGRLYRIPVETFKHYTNKIKERYLVSSGRQSDWREIQNALTWEQRRHIDQKLTDWIGRRGIGYRLIGTSPVELGEGINELTLEDGFGSKQTTSTSNVDALLAPGAMWRFRIDD